VQVRIIPLWQTLIRIAAVALIMISLGTGGYYLVNKGVFSKSIAFTTENDQKNLLVELSDGSKIYLNRNSELTYRKNFGKTSRNVKLTGEAFFDIAHDASRPFIIDAGNAQVKDIGTSFNVITSNQKKEVEVFVKTGKVMLSDEAGAREVVLDPGFIGTMGQSGSSRSLNTNQNYLSWNTDLLVYANEPLKNVFPDLKKIYNIDIVADDSGILNEHLSTTFDKSPQDAIISAICVSFHLKYNKEGNIYHLSRK
jgi:transmembrane sensor